MDSNLRDIIEKHLITHLEVIPSLKGLMCSTKLVKKVYYESMSELSKMSLCYKTKDTKIEARQLKQAPRHIRATKQTSGIIRLVLVHKPTRKHPTREQHTTGTVSELTRKTRKRSRSKILAVPRTKPPIIFIRNLPLKRLG
jgi:hypothetical protein